MNINLVNAFVKAEGRAHATFKALDFSVSYFFGGKKLEL